MSAPIPVPVDRISRLAAWWETGCSILVLVLTLRTFFVLPVVIPTASMEPTFRVGERVLVDRCTVNFQPPGLGVPVVLRTAAMDVPPDGLPSSSILLKRLCGGPGDRIRIRDDRHVELNGQDAANLSPALGRLYRGLGAGSSSQGGPFLGHLHQSAVSRLGGEADTSPLLPDASVVYQVRPQRVWVLGDHSLRSLDSRRFGDVAEEALIGRVWGR